MSAVAVLISEWRGKQTKGTRISSLFLLLRGLLTVAPSTGFSQATFNIRDGVRSSTVEEYLKPAASRHNLHILHGANVLKVRAAHLGLLYLFAHLLTHITTRREMFLTITWKNTLLSASVIIIKFSILGAQLIWYCWMLWNRWTSQTYNYMRMKL